MPVIMFYCYKCTDILLSLHAYTGLQKMSHENGGIFQHQEAIPKSERNLFPAVSFCFKSCIMIIYEMNQREREPWNSKLLCLLGAKFVF